MQLTTRKILETLILAPTAAAIGAGAAWIIGAILVEIYILLGLLVGANVEASINLSNIYSRLKSSFYAGAALGVVIYFWQFWGKSDRQ